MLVTDSAFRLHVFDPWTGAPLHMLKGHKDKAHVLAAHPLNSRIAMTAGYDGLLIVWDVDMGVQLRSLALQHTGPAGWSWCDPLPAVEGRFTPGGDAVVLADAAGQWHVFGSGALGGRVARCNGFSIVCCFYAFGVLLVGVLLANCRLCHICPFTMAVIFFLPWLSFVNVATAPPGTPPLVDGLSASNAGNNERLSGVVVPYDQFWACEANQLIRDEAHNVLDAETQLPAHLPNPRSVVVMS